MRHIQRPDRKAGTRWTARLVSAVEIAWMTCSFGHCECNSLPARSDTEPHPVRTSTLYDPATGQAWALRRKGTAPGGPGILIARKDLPEQESLDAKAVASEEIVRAGDLLEVIDCRGDIEVRLEGIALGPARIGERLNIRTRIFGSELSVVAIGQRKALITSHMGARP